MPQNGVSGPPQLTFSRNVFSYPKSISPPFFPIISATTVVSQGSRRIATGYRRFLAILLGTFFFLQTGVSWGGPTMTTDPNSPTWWDYSAIVDTTKSHRGLAVLDTFELQVPSVLF